MKTINEDIKSGQFKHVYLLYGEESYLISQYRNRLRDALVPDGDTMNVAYFSGKDIRPGELIDLAETMPFFSERRCIFVEESGFFKKASDELAEYMEKIPETTYFVFTEFDMDSHTKQGGKPVDKRLRLFKQVEKYGRAVEFNRQEEKMLITWVLGRLKREGKKITRSVMEYFLEQTGDDMEIINQELEKLICYTMGREVIEKNDVKAICSNQISDQIFQMVDAIADGQQNRALNLYYDLLMLKKSPTVILSNLNKHFQILMQIRELLDQGFDYTYMREKTGLKNFVVRKCVGQARRFTFKQLVAAVRDGVQADEDVKTGRLDENIAVELLLMSYS